MQSQVPTGLGRVVLAFVLTCALPAKAEQPDTSRLSPERSVELALANHPDVRSAEAAKRIAQGARSASALFLGNPQAAAWGTPDGARAELSASQPLSLAGEGWHARGAARWSARAAAATLSRVRRVTAAETRRAYVQASVAVGRADVAAEGADIAGRLRFAIGRQYEEGEASALELRLVQLAEVQAAVRLLQARQDEVNALRALAGRVGQTVSRDALESDPLVAAPVSGLAGEADRADVAAATAALRSAQADVRRQRAAVLPPISVGVGVSIEGGQTFAGPAVSWSLPLFGRNQVDVRTAQGSVSVAEGRLASLRARVQTEQRTAAVRAAEAESLASAMADDAMAQARAALSSIEAGVLAGEIDLPTAVLLQAQVLAGEAAVVTLRGAIADARIDLLLAMDDDALLGGTP